MITIFTPTFNRVDKLKKLYKSLCDQTNNNFEWIVVDDGSTDETDIYINSIINVAPFEIIYFKQLNHGKHVAFNKGIELARGELFNCVDSDDTLSENAIELYSQLSCKSDCVGYLLPRIQSEYDDKGKWEKLNRGFANIVDLHMKYGIVETNPVFKTNILKQIKFDLFFNNGIQEKFCPEGNLYYKLYQYGTFYLININVYRASYLEDGLTKNVYKLWKNNPEGVLYCINQKYEYLRNNRSIKCIIYKIKCLINSASLCIITKRSVLKYSPAKFTSILLFLPSYIVSKKRYPNN